VTTYRRDEYAESTRKAIIEGAIQLFMGHGYLRTSLDEVAHHARVSKGAIYHHFSNKQEVFEAVLTTVTDSQVSGLRSQPGELSDARQDMAGLLGSYLETCIDPLFSRLVLEEGPIALGWTRWREFEREFILDSFIEPAQRWLQAGIDVDVSAEMLLRTLLSAVHEMALTIVDSHDRERATAEARTLIKELVASLDSRRTAPATEVRPAGGVEVRPRGGQSQ
jgi:AcrR family transcriptional regulator